MKKIVLIALMLLLVGSTVYAVNENAGNNSIMQTAREKRVLIRTQSQQLVQLRKELRTKIQEQKNNMNQYREKESLTEEERTQIKEMITAMKTVRERIGFAQQNAVQALAQFKGDTSAGKLTGLDLVIASQQARMKYLQEAIDTLNNL